jgi:ABC-type uncharacterized transport system permease subunit
VNFTERQFFLFAVLAYALSTIYSVFLRRSNFRRDDFVNYLLLALGFAFHTIAIFKRGHDIKHCPVYNLYEACTFFTWFSVLAYLVIGLWHRFRFLGAFFAPVLLAVGVFALMPSLDPPHGTHPQLNISGALQSIHAALSLLAYAAFGLCCAAGLMFLTQEKNLKQHKVNAILSLLPPIQRLEIVVARLMIAGLTLLSAGLVTGAIFLRQNHEVFELKGVDPKIIWSVIVWAAYCGLLVAHRMGRIRGRKFALAAVGLFAFVALTFWGANLLSPIHSPSPTR